MKEKDIDLVVLWVDGSDPVWQQEKTKYDKYGIINSQYYQDWNFMRYWFRGVEENMPWIRYVFFVTFGHTPKWLNLNHPKLKIVNHKDYLPEEFTPTFNSNPINLNIHRIKGLSEEFVYAEDDMFFMGKFNKKDFFSEDGLPKDYLWLNPILENYGVDEYSHIMLNNTLIIKKNFDMQSILKNEDKLISKAYPQNVIEDNIQYKTLKYIPGFKETHLPFAMLKSSFNDLWKKEEEALTICSKRKFRSIRDVSLALVRDWQLITGKFEPDFPKGRYCVDVYDDNLKDLILSKDTMMLCINESNNKKYTKERSDEICSYFEQRFPNKSSFEID